jgi:hypothetical protein
MSQQSSDPLSRITQPALFPPRLTGRAPLSVPKVIDRLREVAASGDERQAEVLLAQLRTLLERGAAAG